MVGFCCFFCFLTPNSLSTYFTLINADYAFEDHTNNIEFPLKTNRIFSFWLKKYHLLGTRLAYQNGSFFPFTNSIKHSTARGKKKD